jgi:alkylation response protein AidB-like acyl-CoA dehydrogenase
MIAKVEALQAWLEAVTYQMCNMTYNETSEHLAGQISFLKMQCTIAAGEIASDAMMVFGGRALTKTGMGRHIQHFHQTQVSVLSLRNSLGFSCGMRRGACANSA